jgi:hypothetical protein
MSGCRHACALSAGPPPPHPHPLTHTSAPPRRTRWSLPTSCRSWAPSGA